VRKTEEKEVEEFRSAEKKPASAEFCGGRLYFG